MTKFEKKGTGRYPSRDCLYINQTNVIYEGSLSNNLILSVPIILNSLINNQFLPVTELRQLIFFYVLLNLNGIERKDHQPFPSTVINSR